VVVAVVLFGLLGAVAHGATAGGLDNLNVGRIDLDFGDVGAVVWLGEDTDVLLEEGESGLVVVLTEEVGLANGFWGKRGVERESRGDKEQTHRQGRRRCYPGMHRVALQALGRKAIIREFQVQWIWSVRRKVCGSGTTTDGRGGNWSVKAGV
jgi:hypothetical protein